MWAAGGLGVRELVFMAALSAGLPPAVRAQFNDPKVLLGFLAFLSVLLRLWATVGELMLAAAAAVADPRGWLGGKLISRHHHDSRAASMALNSLAPCTTATTSIGLACQRYTTRYDQTRQKR